ncbi:MAG: GAF domain-containing protein, partial [Anaerolineae bacterium]|nr:GAF domain-containing protein [Anaerolineae bacterium]
MSKKVKPRQEGRSLAFTLAGAFLALSIIVLLVANSLQTALNYQTQRELVARQQTLIAQNAASAVASFIREKFSELDATARLGIMPAPSAEKRQEVLNNLMGLEFAFRQVVLLDLQGREQARATRLAQVTEGELSGRLTNEAWTQLKQGHPQISAVYIDANTSEPLAVLAVAVTDVFGDPQGILLAEINLKFMWDLVERLQVGATGSAYVVDRQGDLLAFGDISRVLRGENIRYLVPVRTFIDSPAAQKETSVETFEGIEGETVIGTYIPLGVPDWAVVTELPTAEAYREVVRSVWISLGVLLVMAVLAGLAGAYIARRLVAPILGLTEAAARIAEGETGLQAVAEGPSEVISLARAFNYMTRQVSNLLQTVQARSAELEERTKELEASQRVTFAASERATPDELLDLVVNLIRDQFDLYHAQVYLIDEEKQAAVLRQSTGYAGRQLLQRKHQIALDATALVTQAIHTGEAILVDDVKADPNFLPNPLLPDTRSELAVPLKREGKVIGVLDAQDRTAGRFNPSTIALFQSMTDQVAILFENSALLERVTEQTEVMSIFTNQLRTAADIARRLGTILDPEQLLQEVVELIQSRFGLYHAHIYLLDETEDMLKLATGSGEVGRVLRERGHSIPMNAEKSLVARAARARNAVLVVDTTLESDYMPNPLLPQTRSELSLPLMVSDTVLGVLDLQDDQARRFTEAERDTFGTLAGLVATAIQNARLFAAQQEIEAQILQERNFSEAVINSLPGNFYVIDDQANLTRWNESFVIASGYTPEELQQIGALGTIAEEDRAAVAEAIQQVFITGEEATLEAHAATKSGERIPYYYTGIRAVIEGKAYVVGMGIDITDRVRAETAVRESQRRLAEALNIAQMGYWTLDIETNTFTFNDQYYKAILNTTAEEVGGYQIAAAEFAQRFVVPEDAPLVAKNAQLAIESPDPDFQIQFESRNLNANGEEVWTTIWTTAERDAEGRTVGMRGVSQVITERKRAEAELQKRASELQTVAEVSTAASTILEPNRLLSQVVELTKANFDLYHAHIYLIDEAGESLVLAAGAGKAGKQMLAQGWQIAADNANSLVARAFRSREGVVVNDVRAAPDFLPNPLLPDTRSEMAVPLIVGEQVLGVLDVQADQVDHFTSEDVLIQTTLAGQIATALQNAQFVGQVERNLQETGVRFNVSQALAKAQTEEQVLDVLAEQSSLYPQVGVDIMTLERGEDGLTLVGRRSLSFDSGIPETPAGARFPASEFPLVNLITPDTLFTSADVLHDERIDENTRALAVQEGWGSIAIMPITAGDIWLGIIVAVSKEEGRFDASKLALYQTLAEQGAIALQIARLNDE